MRRDLVGTLRFLVLPTLAVAGIVAFVPGRVGIAIRIYALVLCASGLGLAFAALRRAYPRTTPLRSRKNRRSRGRRPPPNLGRLEDEVALGVASSFDLHHLVLPRLRRLALGLLATRRGISLATDPESARRILGDEAWDLVRDDREPPEDRLARGLPPSELKRAVESLERV